MIQAIVNLPPGLPVLDLFKHIMETADVYQLCSGKVPGFKCSVRIKGCDLVHLSVAVTAWPQLLCNTPFSLAFLEKRAAPHQRFFIYTEISRILSGLFSSFKQEKDVS